MKLFFFNLNNKVLRKINIHLTIINKKLNEEVNINYINSYKSDLIYHSSKNKDVEL